tara:strand:+ start:985 stop:1254 length:270 start_codon:yes stop_codon:yes gene_type:complete
MKPYNNPMDSPWRQFNCFYEKNIENYLKSRRTIFFNTNEGTSCVEGHNACVGQGSIQVDNPNFKCETPTPEEYCEWYFKKYGIPKELKK